jgi:hypothetical protein
MGMLWLHGIEKASQYLLAKIEHSPHHILPIHQSYNLL